MNIGASIIEWPLRIKVPPKNRAMVIRTVPRNSLTGWARACRIVTLLVFLRIASVTPSNLVDIFFSAMKAFITLSPPSVSSTWDITSLHNICTSRDLRFRFLPMIPMAQIIKGAKMIVKAVICQLITINAAK